MASVDINIVGAIAPFTYSVKDVNNVERFTSYNSGKIYFDEIKDGNNHEYTVTVTKNGESVINTIMLYSCNLVTPVPTVVITCNNPSLSFISKENKTVVLAVTDTGNCTNYQFQYSSSFDFQYFSSFSVQSCVTQQTLTFPDYGTIYIRIKKTCSDNSSVYSNVISVNLTQSVNPVPVPVNLCLTNCDLYSVYSEVAWGIQYLDCEGISREAYGSPFGASQVCACSGTIESLYGEPLVNLQQAGGCNQTPVPVPTNVPTPIPVSNCKQVVFTVSLQDLQQADGSLVFAEYRDCNSTQQFKTFSSAGTYTYCSNGNVDNVSIYYYKNGAMSPNVASEYNINNTSC